MKISEIHNKTIKPKLYEKGNAVMWTDEHISKQLLHVHLNPDVDLASRKAGAIHASIDWILSENPNKKLNILDLGCGPGLYTEILAKKGHNVTGVDFSANSIDYAKKAAEKKNLAINYLRENYLKLDLEENNFDLVMMIFTDFGVLLPAEREQLLRIIQKVLKPGGTFIFDVLNDKNIKIKTSPKNWDTAEKGFWKSEPYLVLSESFDYQEEKVILFQHMVIDEKEDVKTYRFWTHFFAHSDLRKILEEYSFTDLSFNEDVLPEGGIWGGENVTFCRAEKPL